VRWTTRLRPSHFLGGAISGVVLAHLAAYSVVYPDAATRTTALAEAEHGWVAAGWEMCSAPLALLLVVAVAHALTRRDATYSAAAATRRLTAVQCLGFGVLEIVERHGTSTPLRTVVTSSTFVLGLVLQPLVAALIVGLVSVSEAVATRLFSQPRLELRTPRVSERLPLGAPTSPRPLIVHAGWSSRGPPPVTA
jgi:hypothetical protein